MRFLFVEDKTDKIKDPKILLQAYQRFNFDLENVNF